MESDNELLSFLKKVGMHQSEVDGKLNERKLVEELEGSKNYVERIEKLDYNDHHGNELNFDGKLREKIDSLDVQNGNYAVILPYQDDILIGTNDNIKYHCEVLDDLCQLLTKSRLCLNIKKCVFAVKQIEYLSIIIDADKSCKPAMKFVDPIMSYERPKSFKSVRRYLGLCSI
uniref:Reverse transcriptase domain-containing protein n=1 Tax=Strongyloides venezuelensis TaxID=75913 RepID=A0A0K0FBE5_STRVS